MFNGILHFYAALRLNKIYFQVTQSPLVKFAKWTQLVIYLRY